MSLNNAGSENMATKARKPNQPIIEASPFALAVAVLRERIRELPKADRDDLYSLMPDLLGDDPVAQRSAQMAIDEIMNQHSGRVLPASVAEGHGDDLDSWLTFVSRRIKEQRTKAGMTQDQLAIKAGLPQSHISRLESMQHSPTAMTLEKIARALNVPASVFDPSAD